MRRFTGLFVATNGAASTLATSASALSLTPTNWYPVKAVIAGGTASIYVDTGSGWGSARVSATVNANFDAGHSGLFVASNGGVSQFFDDFEVGIDNNADGDFLDGGDTIEVNQNFDSNSVSLSYDDNGNLIDDGLC